MPDLYAYTDGACSGNPGPGGWGALLQAKSGEDVVKERELKGGEAETTNNRMELLAVIVALEKLKFMHTEAKVFTDSKYVVDSVTKKWVFGWEKKGFSGKKNADLWMRFLKIYRRHIVHFQWIKGHNNHVQNERCDFLAVEASKKEKLKIDTFYENESRKLL